VGVVGDATVGGVAGRYIMRVLVATVLVAFTVSIVAVQPAGAYPAFVEYTLGGLGPRGPIVLVGDSVLVGTVLPGGAFEPTLPG
jgi:hypothetical protein